jgi:hypothetical protein
MVLARHVGPITSALAAPLAATIDNSCGSGKGPLPKDRHNSASSAHTASMSDSAAFLDDSAVGCLPEQRPVGGPHDESAGDWSNKRKRKLTDCSDPGLSSASVRRHPKDFVFDARAVKRQHIVDPSFATVRPGALNGKSLSMPVSFSFPTCQIDPQTAYPAHAQTIRQCSVRKRGSCIVAFLQVQSLCYRVLKERQLGSPCRFGL